MSHLHTLTVPDMLWVNLRLTNSPQKYDFARLEEAVFLQFGYGGSRDILAQAGRLLTGFVRLKPFVKGNEATAFVATVAFLKLNGHDLHLDDDRAAEWVQGVWGKPESAAAALEVLLESHEIHLHHGVPDAHGIVDDVIARYPQTIAALVAGGHVAVIF
jgi:prophage maintenance system killer protein